MKSVLKFGGLLLKGKRKSKRPVCSKRPMHLVLKANSNSLRKFKRIIEVIITGAAKRWGIRIYRIAVAANHIHLVYRVPNRIAYRHFIQWVTGTVALKLKIKWELRPFTRVIEWGQAFKRACKYVEMNVLEALGFIPYQARARGCLRKRNVVAGLGP